MGERAAAERGGVRRVAATTPPVPAGQARVWFYRPYESLNLARIDMNDSYIGSVANGNAFYLDVPPGHYRIVPESFGRDVNQDRNVDLTPASSSMSRSSVWEAGRSVSGSKNMARDTFYAWLIPPQVAEVEIARDRNGI